MTRNPYSAEAEEPTLQPSVLVFMDILGYTEMIKNAEREKKQQKLLRALHKALRTGRNWLEDNESSETFKLLSKTDLYVLKAFTDNIVIGWPVHNDAESEFGNAFFKLGHFQFQSKRHAEAVLTIRV